MAPIRIADLGGWTDTWFAKPGRVLVLVPQDATAIDLLGRPVALQPAGPRNSLIIDGKKDAAPVDEYVKMQGRFNRLLKGPDAPQRIAENQEDVDRQIDESQIGPGLIGRDRPLERRESRRHS